MLVKKNMGTHTQIHIHKLNKSASIRCVTNEVFKLYHFCVRHPSAFQCRVTILCLSVPCLSLLLGDTPGRHCSCSPLSTLLLHPLHQVLCSILGDDMAGGAITSGPTAPPRRHPGSALSSRPVDVRRLIHRWVTRCTLSGRTCWDQVICCVTVLA